MTSGPCTAWDLMTERVEQQDGWLLHHRSYRETSLLLEVFTQSHGRIALIANGARRPKSRLRVVLQPFQPLRMSWTRRGDLGLLRQAELDGAVPGLAGDNLYAGFYANELLMRLCLRGDPHPELYVAYSRLLRALGHVESPAISLRLFERDLLDAIGYGLQLEYEVDSGDPIQANAHYQYDALQGPRRVPAAEGESGFICGAALLALRDGQLNKPDHVQQAKYLIRDCLNRLLENRPLKSVQTLRQLHRLGNT